jgi:hypothetical protein
MKSDLFKFSCIIFLSFVFFSRCFAQNNDQATRDSSANAVQDSATGDDTGTDRLIADSLIIRTVINSAGDSIEKWKHASGFGYMAYLDSLLRKKTDLKVDTVRIERGIITRKKKAKDSAAGSKSSNFLNSFPVRLFFWAVALFFIGFILYKLFYTSGLFAKKNAKPAEPADKEPESLVGYSEYNALIYQAEVQNDFHSAIRYLYLQSLKKLADSGLIIFSADKTNNSYVQELAGSSYQLPFTFLTLNYEYIWYGRFSIDSTRYKKLKQEFILFSKKI